MLKCKLEMLSSSQGRYQCRLCLPGGVWQFPLLPYTRCSSIGAWSSSHCTSSRQQLVPSFRVVTGLVTLIWEPRCPAHCTATRDSPACTSGSVFLKDLPLLLTVLHTTEGSKVLFTTLQTGQEKVKEKIK